MEKKYSVVASKFIGKLGEGDNEIFTYEITFNRSLEHTGKFKAIEDGLNSYAPLPSMLAQEWVSVEGLPELKKGDKIKLYGNETTVTGFDVIWNDALIPPQYEIILLTTGRGHPFKRSLANIELIPTK